MNFKDLKNDFKTRYFTQNEPTAVFAGKTLFLLGGETLDCTGGIMTSLSAGTALIFNLSKTPALFTVQNADTDIAYQCSKNELAHYSDDNFARGIFRIIAQHNDKSDISGLDMLFKNNTTNTDFFNYSGALTKALSCLDNTIVSDEVPPFRTLFLDKNTQEYSENKLSFSGKKIIVITIETKKQNISGMCKSATARLPEGVPLDAQTISEKAFTETDNKLLTFIAEEKKRVDAFKNESDFHTACKAITASGSELFSISNSDKLRTLQNILSTTDSALAFRPAFDNSAIYVITEDFAVDALIKKVEDEYEKKAGSKPAFYICDIGSHHIIH